MFAPNDLQDDDPDAIQAQVDTGAHVSCTDQKARATWLPRIHTIQTKSGKVDACYG